MNKLHLLKQAKNLYCIENLTPDIIAEKLNISRRTIFYWKKKCGWDKIRNKIYKSETKFSTESMDIAIKL